MHLTTLVGILERDQPRKRDLSSSRGNLARLYAERGRHADAVEQFRVVRDAFDRRGEGNAPTAVQTTAALAASLFELGDLDEAKREAERALAAGVSRDWVEELEHIVSASAR